MNTPDALDFCLRALEAGTLTPTECVAMFPDSPELNAELEAARRVQSWALPTLSPEATQRIYTKLRLARAAARPARFRFSLRLPVLLSLGLLIVASIGVGTVSASSLPGDALYGLKRTEEGAQLAITAPAGRAGLYLALAARRLDEASALASRSPVQAALVSETLSDMESNIVAALAAVPDGAPGTQRELLAQVIQEAGRQEQVLQTIRPRVPAEARAGLDQALAAASSTAGLAEQQLRQITTPAGDTATATPANTSEATATPSPQAVAPLLPSAPPPGLTKIPPGQTQIPPGQTQVPPGQTKIPPGQTQVPPGQTKTSPEQTHIPPGQTQVPPGQTHIPPGQTNVPQGQTQAPPGQTHAPPGPTRRPAK